MENKTVLFEDKGSVLGYDEQKIFKILNFVLCRLSGETPSITLDEAKSLAAAMVEDLESQTLTSSQVEQLGISRPLLGYYVKNKYIRTIPHGKQKRYVKADVLKFARS